MTRFYLNDNRDYYYTISMYHGLWDYKVKVYKHSSIWFDKRIDQGGFDLKPRETAPECAARVHNWGRKKIQAKLALQAIRDETDNEMMDQKWYILEKLK